MFDWGSMRCSKVFFFFFIEQIKEPLQSNFKCIKSVIPRASTYVFIKDRETGALKSDHIVQDEKREYLSGYVSTYAGDSGSPYWKTGASNRAILIGIVSSKFGPKFEPRSTVSEEPEKECTNKASKVTEVIVSWIKQHAEIKSSGTKRTHDDETSNQSK